MTFRDFVSNHNNPISHYDRGFVNNNLIAEGLGVLFSIRRISMVNTFGGSCLQFSTTSLHMIKNIAKNPDLFYNIIGKQSF